MLKANREYHYHCDRHFRIEIRDKVAYVEAVNSLINLLTYGYDYQRILRHINFKGKIMLNQPTLIHDETIWYEADFPSEKLEFKAAKKIPLNYYDYTDKGIKILVCGGRDYNDRQEMREFIDLIYKTYTNDLKTNMLYVVHGNCRGADKLFEQELKLYCNVNFFPTPNFKRYTADWSKYGKAAGPKRNQQMINENKDIDFAIAFRGGKGTEDMIKRLKVAGIQIVYPPKLGILNVFL